MAAKIFGNLVHLGTCHPDGTLAADTTNGMTLATATSPPYRETLFKLIGTAVNGTAAFYRVRPGRARRRMTPDEPAELYDNLVYNGYIDESGDLTDPDLLPRPGQRSRTSRSTPTSPTPPRPRHRPARRADRRVHRRPARPRPGDLRRTAAHRRRAGRADREPHLQRLPRRGTADYRDKAALATLPVKDFGLALGVLPAAPRRSSTPIQAQIRDVPDRAAHLHPRRLRRASPTRS